QGSDERWGGYRRYQAELWREHIPFPRLVRLLAPLLRPLPLPEFLERAFTAIPLADREQRFAHIYALPRGRGRARLSGSPSRGCAVSSMRYWLGWLGEAGRPNVEAMMAIGARMGLADNLLLYGDKISMAHSLEARVPMLDLELARFVE